MLFVANQYPRAMLCLFTIAFCLFAIKKISEFDERKKDALVTSVMVLFVIQSVMVFLQMNNIDPIFNSTMNPLVDDTVGLSGSHNQVGLFFADTLPFILFMFPVGSVLSITGLFCSTTTSAMVGGAAGALFMAWFVNKRAFIGSLISLLFVFIVFINKFENINKAVIDERYNLAKHSVNAVLKENLFIIKDGQASIVKCNKWVGYGLGNFIRISPHGQSVFLVKQHDPNSSPRHRYEHVHNDIIEVFFELGIVGVLSVLLVFIELVYKFIKARKTPFLIMITACLVAHVVTSMGIYTVHTAVSGMMLVVFLGLFYREVNNATKKQGIAQMV